MQIHDVIMPHAFMEISEAKFHEAERRHIAQRTSKSVVFKKVNRNEHDRYYLVGHDAVGFHQKRLGVAKYARGYMDVYISALLSRLYPNGHDNIVLFIAHPPNALSYIEDLIRSIGSTHTIKVAGHEKATYKIKAIVPFDENVGGVVRAMSVNTSNLPHFRIDNNEIAVICDIGGRIGSMYNFEVQNGKPNIIFEEGNTFEIGIEQVKENLIVNLRSSHGHIFKWDDNPRIIDKIIRSQGYAEIRGETMDFVDPFNMATGDLLTAIRNVYENHLKHALDAKHIILTGGGSGALNGLLQEYVFDSGHTVRLADNASDIAYANMRGGKLIARQNLEIQASNNPKLAQMLNDNSTVIVIDAGNSQGKAGILW